MPGFRTVSAKFLSILLLAMAFCGSAFAQPYAGFSITAPAPGTTVPAQGNLAIQWTGGDPSWTIDLRANRMNPWGTGALLVVGNIPNSGSFNWTLPASLDCNEEYILVIGKTAPVDGNWAWGPVFTPKCPDVGEVAVAKTVTNNTPGDLNGWQYPVTIACGGGASTTISLLGGAPPQYVSNLTPGVACTVTEVLPLPLPVPPKGRTLCPEGLTAQWLLPTYSPAQNTIAGSRPVPVTVHNTLSCVDPNSAAIAVVKTVTNNTPADLTGWRYPATLTCAGTVVSTIQLADAAPQYVSGAGVALGTSCTVAEVLPLPLPVAPEGRPLCPPGTEPQWLPPTYTPGQTAISATQPDMVTINNILTCVKTEKPTGTLTVVKKVTNNTGATLPSDWRYPVSVSCEGSSEESLGLPDGGSATVNVAPGEDCKVIEDTQSLPLPEKACPEGLIPQWTVITPNDYVHAGDTAVIENVLDCVRQEKPPGGTITVEKRVTNNTGATLPAGWLYPIDVYCDGGPAVTLSLADGVSGTVPGVAPGILCKVTEDPPVLPASVTEGACPPGFVVQWTVMVPNDYVQAGDTATVQNVLDCVRAEKPPGGTLTVWKYVSNLTLFPLTGWLYPISIDCGGTITLMNLADGGSAAVTNIPLGTTCTVAETLPLPLPPGAGNECFTATMMPQWLPPVSYFPAPSVQITAQPATIFVLNTLNCVPRPNGGGATPSELTITKVCSEASETAAGDFAAQCQITVTATGTIPATITIVDGLDGPLNIPGFENQIVSMTSPEGWICPPMPVVAGVDAFCELPGADLAAAGGQSVIDVVVQFNDPGNASESENCVTVFGLDAAGAATATAPVICAAFEGPGIAPCDDGMVRRSGTCVVPAPKPQTRICTDGTMLVEGTCVKVAEPESPRPNTKDEPEPESEPEADLICKRPFVLNRAGTECICPRGMEETDSGTCVRPEDEPELPDIFEGPKDGPGLPGLELRFP